MYISACYYVPRQLYLISMTQTIRYKLVKNTFKLENRTYLFNKNMNYLRWLGDRSISYMGTGWGSWASSASRREHREQISSMRTRICKVSVKRMGQSPFGGAKQQGKWQQSQTEIREVPSKCEEKLLSFEGDRRV